MWMSIFEDRQERMDCISGLCEGSVVGRCLEKILGVDVVQSTIRRGPTSTAVAGSSPGTSDLASFQPKANSPAPDATLPSASKDALGLTRAITPGSDDKRAVPPSPKVPCPHDLEASLDAAATVSSSEAPSPLAVVSNMFLKASVDLKSLLYA